MQKQLPKNTTLNSLSSGTRPSITRRLYSDKFVERFPYSPEKDFVCPCCRKTKDINEARIKRIVHENNTVGVRTIHTKTETFSFRLCEDCCAKEYQISGRAAYVFWIAFAVVALAGILISSATNEIYPAMASILLGLMIAFYLKKLYKWVATEHAGTNISFKRACDCNAVVK